LRKRTATWQKIKDLSPALFGLVCSVLFHYFYSPEHPTDIWRILFWVIARFLGDTVILCLPLYLVKPIYSSILEGRSDFLQVEPANPFKIGRLKHWLFRPFQGIGISFLFATRLLTVVHMLSGPFPDSSIPFTPPGHFTFERIFIAAAITIVISLLLSVLWAFDDLGIRYYNRKDQELKMIGRYVGTVVPLIFGIYGVFNLHIRHAQTLGESPFLHVFQIIITLYPSLAVFTIVHNYFIKKRAQHFSDWVSLTPGGIWWGSKRESDNRP
jgi:hypothetical protein